MSAPRVLLVSFIPASPWTGMGRWTRQMAESLAGAGYRTTVWFDRDFPRLARMGRLAVLLYPVSLAFRLVRRRRTFAAVIIHEPGGFWYGQLRRVWWSLPPMLVMCHNVESRFHRDMHGFARDGLAAPPSRLRAVLLRHWQSNGAIRRADHVLCLSREDRNYITQELGVHSRHVTRITNGVALSDFVERRPDPDRRAVLWVGGWLDVKGRRLLPPLWRAVRRRVQNATLTLIGTGKHADAVLAAFDPRDRDSIQVQPSIRHRAEMQRRFAEHDLLLVTSLSEGAPLAVLEAMAAALPIVATRVGGIPELVAHGTEGLLFDPRRADTGAEFVATLLADERQAASLGQAARDRARSFTWAAAAETLGEIVQRVRSEPR